MQTTTPPATLPAKLTISLLAVAIAVGGCAPASAPGPAPATDATTADAIADVAPVVVSRAAWGASEPIAPMRPHRIERITIHHTAFHQRPDESLEEKLRWLQAFSQAPYEWGEGRVRAPWADIPYHFFIAHDGRIGEGRPLGYAGETATAYDPTGHLLIVLEGNFEEEEPTAEQLASLRHMVRHHARRWGVPPHRVQSHRDYTPTLCPGAALYPYLDELRELVAGDLAAASAAASHIRVNQVGYLPDAPKTAVVCSLEPIELHAFRVVDGGGRVVYGPAPARPAEPFGPCVATHRLEFSALRAEGEYRIEAGAAAPARIRIARDAYAGAADTLLMYMRQQRSGFNPLFGDSVHHRTDAILVDHARAGEFIPVAGGWHDAADYLQYVTTSANATYVMLIAYRDNAPAFADLHDADGLPGANGVPDVLDEARHGLEWLLRMFPDDDLLLNQIADDRDHTVWSLPPTDSADYGWGPGGYRPVYPCTGRPQGLLGNVNRSDGLASTAGKFASAMALGAQLFRDLDPAFADRLAGRAIAAYELGREHPGVCQTAPARMTYFYEEDNWVDDMQLAAAQLHALTREARYLREAIDYAHEEPVTPWMGQDTAHHYQWYPWHNNGHHEVWRLGSGPERRLMAAFYRRGLEKVAARAGNGFRVGIPFIWCSNNLMTSFATQAYLYRSMTGDETFLELEHAALDWLFGTNPWGVSMVIGYPARGNTSRDPHSIVAREMGTWTQTGGLLDGPVYRSIFENLAYIQLYEPDRYARFNTGHVVYHDDFGDYSTNEPIMDGTANLIYLVSALAAP